MAQQRTTFTCWWSTRRRFPSPQLVNHLKGVSSRILRQEFPALAARGTHLWTPSYFTACAGGAPIERLREYVEAQETPS